MWITNDRQAEAFAKFLFDVARGSLLGALGLSATVIDLHPIVRLANLSGGLLISYMCVRMALSLLK